MPAQINWCNIYKHESIEKWRHLYLCTVHSRYLVCRHLLKYYQSMTVIMIPLLLCNPKTSGWSLWTERPIYNMPWNNIQNKLEIILSYLKGIIFNIAIILVSCVYNRLFSNLKKKWNTRYYLYVSTFTYLHYNSMLALLTQLCTCGVKVGIGIPRYFV